MLSTVCSTPWGSCTATGQLKRTCMWGPGGPTHSRSAWVAPDGQVGGWFCWPSSTAVSLSALCVTLLQIAANPLMLAPVTRLGEDAMLTTVDSSHFAALGEELNFWQLMVCPTCTTAESAGTAALHPCVAHSACAGCARPTYLLDTPLVEGTGSTISSRPVQASRFAAMRYEDDLCHTENTVCVPASAQARCQTAGDVLLGYYEIPEHLDEPLNTVINPIGLQVGDTIPWGQSCAQLGTTDTCARGTGCSTCRCTLLYGVGGTGLYSMPKGP
jgi:hypothetical protein